MQDNRVGAFYDDLRTSPYYSVDGTGTHNNFFTKFPLNFFVPNPWAYNSLIMDNSSWSNYHGMELELRRRFSSGLFFQANYTFSKALTDQRFGTSQSESQLYRDLANPKLDKYRSPLDQQHVVSANFIFPLPFGRGQAFGRNMNVVLDKIVGGWQIQGMTRWATGSPFSISGGRWTTGSITETAVLNNMTMKELAGNIGTYKTADGVFWLNPESGLFTVQGTKTVPTFCTTGQTTPCFAYPGAGQMGNTSFFQWSGPTFWNQDFSFAKKVSVASISEQFNVEFRLEMFNAFNHATFANPAPTLTDSSSFGKLTSLVDTSRGGGVNSRNMAFQLRVNF